jgi:hypothetical protein
LVSVFYVNVPNIGLHLTAFGAGMRALWAKFLLFIQSLFARIGGK